MRLHQGIALSVLYFIIFSCYLFLRSVINEPAVLSSGKSDYEKSFLAEKSSGFQRIGKCGKERKKNKAKTFLREQQINLPIFGKHYNFYLLHILEQKLCWQSWQYCTTLHQT